MAWCSRRSRVSQWPTPGLGRMSISVRSRSSATSSSAPPERSDMGREIKVVCDGCEQPIESNQSYVSIDLAIRKVDETDGTVLGIGTVHYDYHDEHRPSMSLAWPPITSFEPQEVEARNPDA